MTVLCAYRPNDHDTLALAAATAEARRRDEPLVVLNITEGDAAVDDDALSDDATAELEQRLSSEHVDARIDRQIATGRISDTILEHADRPHITLLVIGVRHRSPVGKFVMGSTAQRIILDATCNVLCVKP